MNVTKDERTKRSILQLRIGVGVWFFSWLPIPLVIVTMLSAMGVGSTKSQTSLYAISIAIQYAIGFLGIAIAGKQTIAIAKKSGWKKVPTIAWHLMWYGQSEG